MKKFQKIPKLDIITEEILNLTFYLITYIQYLI